MEFAESILETTTDMLFQVAFHSCLQQLSIHLFFEKLLIFCRFHEIEIDGTSYMGTDLLVIHVPSIEYFILMSKDPLDMIILILDINGLYCIRIDRTSRQCFLFF